MGIETFAKATLRSHALEQHNHRLGNVVLYRTYTSPLCSLLTGMKSTCLFTPSNGFAGKYLSLETRLCFPNVFAMNHRGFNGFHGFNWPKIPSNPASGTPLSTLRAVSHRSLPERLPPAPPAEEASCLQQQHTQPVQRRKPAGADCKMPWIPNMGKNRNKHSCDSRFKLLLLVWLTSSYVIHHVYMILICTIISICVCRQNQT